MIRQTVARVDLEAVAANVATLRVLLDEEDTSPGIIAVVKANAYGHGAVAVARRLEQAGVDILACADIEEGIELRKAGITKPILVFGALSLSDLDGVFDFDLTPTVSTPTAAAAIEEAGARRGAVVGCHLKIDTGMNRLGFRHDNLDRTMPAIAASRHMRVDAVYTHFACADNPESASFEDQRVRFERALAVLDRHGIRPKIRHAANSAATLRDRRTWYDFVRPGLLLYGIVPPPLGSTLPFKPALSLTSRVVAVKDLRAGEGVGYGLRYTPAEPRQVAVVPAGYADGLDTRLANKGVALVRGRRAAIVGSVCMDMIMLDVTGCGVNTGDEVVLIGSQGDEEISAREVAGTIGTIPWEIVCRLGARIARSYEPGTR
ncbi:MAG: alanine racemase [Acidobacteriota bacterium]|nr:alanine racemase [Acidobacteriota bacterium]